MAAVKIGLLGFGTVGQGVLALWRQNRNHIAGQLGIDWEIVMIARRRPVTDNIAADWAGIIFTQDPFAVVNNPDIDIVVELIGGSGIAKDLILQALNNGKSVVTANKKLLAEHGNEIFALAAQQKVAVKFEAAVAGGIPIIKVLQESLAANNIKGIAGIINGTSNFVLSDMADKGVDFSVALTAAQKLGYAEADPAFDIAGIDAGHKIAILSALAFATPINFGACYLEGIEQIRTKDIAYAAELGYRIKLLALTRKTAAGIELRVHPALIPKNQLLAHVNGVMNAVYVDTDMLGKSLYYGAGAGGLPTASAVVADLIDLSRAFIRKSAAVNYGFAALSPGHDCDFVPISAISSSYYLRLNVKDEVGVLSAVTQIFAAHAVSIEVMLQKTAANAAAELVILTHCTAEKEVMTVIAAVAASGLTTAPVVMIRTESFAD